MSGFMNGYAEWVSQNPLTSAALQFAILGTLGEVLSHSLRQRRIALPCTAGQLYGKVAAWALLGIIIKAGFVGMRGFTIALLDHGLLPDWCGAGFGFALALSVLTNTFFGPQMMAFHRLEDNLILRQWNYNGLTKAWWTLLWFWIPAHTLTFSLPADYQIGLAALWSVALGLIMGFSKGSPQAKKKPRKAA
ncbi:MAG: hypothetical protein C4524_10715 [Candidatus Zixiibacteriota bacterium]|nr:MAG: hypothetical protein C4524_10715 [candidate division Zixibacteria bacterium]